MEYPLYNHADIRVRDQNNRMGMRNRKVGVNS